MNDIISRRKCIQKIGFGLASASLLSLSSCQTDTGYGTPRIVPAPHLSRSNFRLPYSSPGYNGWIPPQYCEDKARWNAIIIHHTATNSGSASIVDRMHKKRGFDGLGYDFIINNGKGGPDGLVEVGYRWKQQLTGAHCRSCTRNDNYWNQHAIGVVLVGNFEEIAPTDRQYQSLANLITFLKSRYVISDSNILAHKQVPGCNTKCPGRNFSWYKLNRKLQATS